MDYVPDMIAKIKKYGREIIEEKHDNDVKEAFELIDEEGSGEIYSEELREIMKNISSDITED